MWNRLPLNVELETYFVIIKEYIKTWFGPTVMDKIFETNLSCEIVHYGKSSISIFQEFLASINKIFFLGERPSTRL